MRGGGQPLSETVRSYFEPRFGYDFSKVRVHTNSRADEMARGVNARAFTLGKDMVFGTGQYAPDAKEGRQLLAHELTHVVQQSYMPESILPLSSRSPALPFIQRRVRAGNVSCRNYGLQNPNLTGAQAVAEIQAADAEAITLTTRAERLLEFELLLTQAGLPVNAAFDIILQQELGLSLANPAQHALIQQQIDRFRSVRVLLESGYLRYMCRGGIVTLSGCLQGSCGAADFAFACPANRLIVLCQLFWNHPAERGATILHEAFHVLFHMRHRNRLRRANAFCFEAFALRVAGNPAPVSCAAGAP